jgi:hypothetical protein
MFEPVLLPRQRHRGDRWSLPHIDGNRLALSVASSYGRDAN